MTLNLHHLAAQVIHDSATPDPGVMADEFVSRIAPEDHREALILLARSFIREVVHTKRATTNGGAPRQGSARVTAAREAWRRILNTPEYVPSAGWVFLRDATREQVIEMSRLRSRKAQELTVASARYQSIADAMEQRRVKRVADLPADTLERLLDGIEQVAA